MTDFHDKPCHSKSDLVEDPNKPQEGSRKTSFAFVSDRYIVGETLFSEISAIFKAP